MSDLADAIGRAIIAPVPDDGSSRELALVRRAAEADRVTAELLQQAVNTARGSGTSWAAIGGVLGLTRQAAQQRFGREADRPDHDEVSAPAAEERWLGPVTAFDEMAELELAGRLGWHTVGAGMLRHRMVRTGTQWEHKRVVWSGSLARYHRDGWEIGCRALPWIYLIRDTGLPAETARSRTASTVEG